MLLEAGTAVRKGSVEIMACSNVGTAGMKTSGLLARCPAGVADRV